MPSTINATPTSSGLISSADTSGVLALQTGGTTAVTIDGSQNVGIGTSSPSSFSSKTLQVTGSGTDVAIKLTNSTTGSGSGSGFDFELNFNDINYVNRTASGTQKFWTNSTERMRIDSSGNVGIGTSSPAAYSNQKTLALNGTWGGRFDNVFGGTVNSSWYSDSSQNNYFGTITNFPQIFVTNNAERMRIDSSGGLILAGSAAQKATGTTWSNPSDARLKDNIRDYTKGIDELMQVRVREWEYNGKGGTVEGTKGLGVIADEVITVLPDTIQNYQAKLNADDIDLSDIKKFDATEITWLLVKTVQEQQTLITQLQADVAALKVQP